MKFNRLKRLLAIILIVVHLFNLAGYSLYFEYLGNRAAQQIAVRIDQQQFNESDLVELKVKLNLPYFTSSSEYESLEGEININGSNHSYVKRKVSQDTLYVLCLPNTEKDHIQQAAGNYGSVANDFDTSHKKDGASKKTETFNQFQEHHTGYALTAPQLIVKDPKTFISTSLPDSFVDMYGKPPRVNS